MRKRRRGDGELLTVCYCWDLVGVRFGGSFESQRLLVLWMLTGLLFGFAFEGGMVGETPSGLGRNALRNLRSNFRVLIRVVLILFRVLYVKKKVSLALKKCILINPLFNIWLKRQNAG